MRGKNQHYRGATSLDRVCLTAPGAPYSTRAVFDPSISALKNEGQKMSTSKRATFLDRVCLRVCRCTPYSTRVMLVGFETVR